MNCAVTGCQSAAVPKGSIGGRAGGGRSARQRKPSANGKHTSLHHWNCFSTTAKRGVGILGVRQRSSDTLPLRILVKATIKCWKRVMEEEEGGTSKQYKKKTWWPNSAKAVRFNRIRLKMEEKKTQCFLYVKQIRPKKSWIRSKFGKTRGRFCIILLAEEETSRANRITFTEDVMWLIRFVGTMLEVKAWWRNKWDIKANWHIFTKAAPSLEGLLEPASVAPTKPPCTNTPEHFVYTSPSIVSMCRE